MSASKHYNKNFFKQWTSDMAYVLGFLYADGNIVQTKRGNHYVAIYSADKSIMLAMCKAFDAEHKVSARVSVTGCVYRIQIGSKEWFTDLSKLGLIPNKTHRLRLPKIPEQYLGDFIRGYFDGDGNVWMGIIHKDRPITTLTLQVAFTSCCHSYLVELRQALIQRGLRGGSVFRRRDGNYSRLMVSVRDALKLYEIMYNSPHKLYLKRKKIVFEQFMKMRE